MRSMHSASAHSHRYSSMRGSSITPTVDRRSVNSFIRSFTARKSVVELPLQTYKDIRAQGNRHFFVLPRHNGDGESVVSEGDGAAVVEKLAGDGAMPGGDRADDAYS